MDHNTTVFIQLALVLSLSCLFGYLVHRLKLPLIVAYLSAGVALTLTQTAAQFGLGAQGAEGTIFRVLPDIGIAFVLFLIGMELDLRELRLLGKPILFASLLQSFASAFFGFLIARYLGFGQIEGLLMGAGLAFSSTVVAIKILIEKHDVASLHGRIAIGMLLVEDLVAIIFLMVITLSSTIFVSDLGPSLLPLGILFVKGAALFLFAFIISRYLLERIFDEVANSVELLFLTAISWCFIFTSIAVWLEFSVVIGAFMAGIALASSPYRLQIQGKVKPLRDFFVTLFFVYLGSQGNLLDVLNVQAALAIIIFTIWALTGKPLVTALVLSLFGFRKHTIFKTALNLSHISEFSLIIMLFGVSYNLVSPTALSVISAVVVLSIILSSIINTFSKTFYGILIPLLNLIEHKEKTHFMETRDKLDLDDHVVIIGAHRVGGPVVKYLKSQDIPFIVMDFNPHLVQEMRENGFKVIYGDVGDPEVLDNLKLESAKLVISTAQDLGDNELLLEELKRRKSKAKVIVRAVDSSHVKLLKKLGADYVILPETVSGDFLVSQLKTHWPDIHFSGLD